MGEEIIACATALIFPASAITQHQTGAIYSDSDMGVPQVSDRNVACATSNEPTVDSVFGLFSFGADFTSATTVQAQITRVACVDTECIGFLGLFNFTSVVSVATDFGKGLRSIG